MLPMSSRRTHLAAYLVVSLAGGGCHLPARSAPTRPDRDLYFSNFPIGASPADVGRRVAANWAARKFIFETSSTTGRYDSFVHYAEVATWYGALELARLDHDADLEQRLIRKFDTLRSPAGAAHISSERHVDFSVFGAVPLELFLVTRDSAYLTLGRGFADRQWDGAPPNGISREARYWADDMFMIPLLQVQAFRATGERAYLDRAANMLTAYLDSLQQPNGLFFHGTDSPFYWGRGNGWAAAGLSEMLTALPENHPRHAAILSGYRRMMASLGQYQAPTGMWRQLVDKPELWEESSGSAMFAYAMIAGVKNGWLDPGTYGPAARRAWLALVTQLDDRANLRNICVGTGKASDGVGKDLAAQYRYYDARPRTTGDLHGQAPMLWAAAALLRR